MEITKRKTKEMISISNPSTREMYDAQMRVVRNTASYSSYISRRITRLVIRAAQLERRKRVHGR